MLLASPSSLVVSTLNMMAARPVSVEDFDQLVESALNDINSRYQHNERSAEEKENLKMAAVERLPDDFEYKVIHSLELRKQSSNFVLQARM